MNRRDRDEAGRARNARPRDASGRPLPRGTPGVATTPEEAVRDPGESITEAQRLLDHDYPFHAHEVLEAAWKASDGPAERAVWKGLAQLAVGLTHVQRRNAIGAVALLRRGAEGIAPYAGSRPHGLDLDGLVHAARALADRIDDGGLDRLGQADTRLRLRAGPGVGE